MKNIHVLPTEKPSIICKLDNVIVLSKVGTITNNIKSLLICQNIYITDDSEIKEGDWYITSDNKILKCSKVLMQLIYSENDYGRNPNGCKKIILTTDQDLIKDGVQAIDDKFLEWFVKNPSCEFIFCTKTSKVIDLYAENEKDKWEVKYELIIPKEEPKQETLEEAKADYFVDFAISNKDVCGYSFGVGWDKAIKWAEQNSDKKYSEEDMREAFKQGHKSAQAMGSYNSITEQEDFDKFIKQFKNK